MALIGEMQYLTIGGNTYSISAGAKTFIVTLTESNGVYTSDKTAEEIYTAFNAGDTVLLDCGSYVLLSSVYGEDDYYQADFYKSEASTRSFHKYQYIITTNDGITSVDYTDYETPVNNGSLVIQKNGSTVGTFSANSSSNITANITVPTKVSDLTNDSGFITVNDVPQEVFIVTITYSNDGYSFDKTYAEIISAYNSGKYIVGHDTSFNNYYYIKSVYEHSTEGQIVFSNFIDVSEPFSSEYQGYIVCNVIYMDSSNNITSGVCQLAVPTRTSHLTNDSGFITSAGTGLSKSGTTLNHSNSVTAQTTQAVYPIKIDAQGHISAYGNAVTIPTVPSNIVNTITTTAGTHTAISSKTGAVSFNVPTKTSHLTNDSGYITDVQVDGTSVVTGGVAEIDLTDTKVFLVTITQNDPDDDYVSDKTAKEIINAYNAGRVVMASRYGNLYYLTSANELHFPNYDSYNAIFNYLLFDFSSALPSLYKAVISISTINDVTTVDYNEYSVNVASGDHTHGNITNAGKITTTATITSGDRLVINDESAASKITNSSITFGTSTSQYLANNGTWQNIPTVPTKTSDLTNDSGFINSIKTINNQSLIGSGDITVSTTAAQIIRWTESA